MARTFKRRSLLYVPGSSEKMISKAREITSVDAIIFDLEDSVAPLEKTDARIRVCNVLSDIREKPTKIEWMVRVNAFSTEYAIDDLISVIMHRPDAVIIPKATQEVVVAADMILSMLEMKYGIPHESIGIIPLIETAIGVQDIYNIIGKTSRIVAVQFGAEDFTRDMEIARTADHSEIAFSRNKLAIACRARGIDCVDTPYVDFRDLDGCRRDTQFVKSIGMTGRTIIHPSLIDLTNAIFSPSDHEIDYAKRVVEAYETSVSQGRGAVSMDGKMIDVPVVERARKLLEKVSKNQK